MQLIDSITDKLGVTQNRIEGSHLLMAVVVLDCILIHCVNHLLLIPEHVTDIFDLQDIQALICRLLNHFL